jgi:3-phosphoshikimate 1-carboxyvinyltransferase
LLLIAAKLPLGLELDIEGDLTSRPYVEMTLSHAEAGKHTTQLGRQRISIANQEFANIIWV